MRIKIIALTISLMALVTGLFLSEFLVRRFFPRYQYAAKLALQYEQNRLVARVPNQRLEYVHPDDHQKKITVEYNSQALRGPEISWDKEQQFWGFFGDSFVENLRLEYADTFTALINQKAQNEVNTVNFGVEGYGTDQAYLYYRHFAHREKLKKVFYFFCHNDLRDMKNNRLFEWDEHTGLTLVLEREISSIKRWFGQWHLTYLILEVYQRWQGNNLDRFIGADPEMQMVTLIGEKHFQKRFELMGQGDWRNIDQQTQKIFHQLLKQWMKIAQQEQAQFHLVILPDLDSHQLALELGLDQYPDVLFLRPAFLEVFEQEDDWTFQNDYHWNEEANNFLASLLWDKFKPSK